MQLIGTYVLYVKNKQKKDKCKSTKDGHKHLSNILPEFQKNDGLPFCLDKVKGNYDTLENALIKKGTKYHKKGYNNYSEEKLKQVKERQNKLNIVSNMSEQLCSPSQSTRSRDTLNHDFGKLVCCFCSKTDTESNLTAGTFHATKNKVDINHVSNLTEKWKTMAAKLDYSELLSKLLSGYIVSNELYYHKSTIGNCYVEFCNEYKWASKTSDEDKANNKWLKALALNKIIYYVIETGRSNNVKPFKVKDLEEMYMSLLRRTNIYYENHVKQFACKLVLQGPFLEKYLVNNNVRVLFRDAIDEIIHKSSIKPNVFLRCSCCICSCFAHLWWDVEGKKHI